MRVIWELIWRTWRGRLLRSVRLARQPKYFIGTIFGLAYFGWLVVRPAIMTRGPGGNMGLDRIADDLLAGFHVVAAIAVALYVSVSWLLVPAKPGLRLREPELHLLLPAPVPRTTLIQFAVLRAVPGIAAASLLLGFLFGSGPLVERAPRALGLFAVFLFWDLHGKGRNLWKMRLRELPPAAAAWRRGAMVAGLACFWGITGWGILEIWGAFRDALAAGPMGAADWADTLRNVSARAETGLFGIVLLPLRWLTAPLVAPPGFNLLPAWIFIAVLIVLHYAWVVLAQTRFEEALLAQEQQAAAAGPRGRRQRDPRRFSAKSRTSAPFRLAPLGRPEISLFWKDLLVLGRTPLRTLATWYVGILIAVAVAVSVLGIPVGLLRLAFGLSIGLVGVIPFISGMIWSNGFRRDMRHIELLKSWPVDDHRLVTGQLLAPVAQSIGLVLAGAGVLAALDLGSRVAALSGRGVAPGGIFPERMLEALGADPWTLPVFLLLGLVPGILGVTAVSSAVECIGVLLLPGWFLTLDDRRGDPASMGQRMLVGLGFGLVMLFGVLPGALSVGIVILVQRLAGFPVTAWELPILGLLAGAPLLVEAWLLTRLGGKLWRKMDPSREILEGFR